ncbi:MAG: branched-chain amino acid ABC transporter permease [Candidatus Tectomicrobia bacterium]|uniref:Branched-chain amino acid ABC transporter permease n=1 Tax=Tectimicrobiota bacterium TaxID=2528274 RepID=A0A932M155_UNCTE|nr:branched-chain amino acid ABC transporter permease [Candidatus Tectomicrobia bacterium]
MAIFFFVWVILGSSWNLLGGYGGQVSFGHAAFFGVGAYTSSLLFVKAGISPWIGMVLGGVAGALLSIPIGWICFRLRGPFFALSVLALSEALRLVALNWRSLTEGAVGILLPPVFLSKVPFYYIGLGIVLITLWVISVATSSKLGFYLVAVREDQDAAEALGINTTGTKIKALIISAFFTGMAGSFYANYMGYIDPPIVFSIVDVSIAMILVAVLGGVGTLGGPVVGAFIVVIASEIMRSVFAAANLLIYGILIILVILFLPEGIVGSLQKRLRPSRGAATGRA